MKNLLPITLLATLFLGSTVHLLAQVNASSCYYNPSSKRYENIDGSPCTNTVSTAVPFLRIVGDARSGAMGDVGIGISADPNAIHFNASKLAFAEQKTAISATYTPWLRSLGLNDVYLAYLTGYTKLDDLQALGLACVFSRWAIFHLQILMANRSSRVVPMNLNLPWRTRAS